MTAPLPYLDEADVFGLVPFADAVAALAKALSGGLDPQASLQRSIHDVEHGQLLLMPAETATAAGVKLSTVAPGNSGRGLPRVQALYVLYDRVTLTPVALLDGTALTTLRTPAVSAVAVDHLAAPGARHLVVLGSGPQAWGHVEALLAVRPLSDVTVVGRDPDRAAVLVARIRDSGLDARVGNHDDVADADVVVCATTARQPLFDGRRLRPGTCAVAVGSHEPDARELDDVTIGAAERVVVESRGVALREAGDIIQAVRAGVVAEDDLIELRDAVRLAPTTGSSVFKSVGMGWQDLVVADLAHQRWTERGPA
ncbi:ornithine cyclodeaminase family protein [Micromonospora sp. 15K316]|uniref:ornithine cyclodeaminase family protein n=1 Tax=Micromonospora sp. 15K316 TaxID=2530376 RepID=UPI00104CA343|nr:ornithine cyclodeaminase family protein [Micromonospora sp. 15K316]TDC37225.1 ornithine cyclodeaminase family protein [Micromonospora sp. 15K316]